MSMTTGQIDLVTCQGCGQDVPKKSACGVGFGGHMSWTCCDCIKAGMFDRVLAPIGTTIRDTIAKHTAPARTGEGGGER